jgi:3-oxoadipate enol-lactonase
VPVYFRFVTTDQRATTREGSLYYQVEGPEDGPAVLLINSLATRLELWDHQAAELSKHARLIRYDARGHGRSSVPAGEYTLEQLGRDALAVLDAAGVRSAAVGGISLGGLTALWLGVHAPERITALLVANTAARVGTVERWTERVTLVRTKGLAAVAEMTMANWFTEEFRARERATIERFRSMVASCPLDGYVGCCAALRDADLREAIAAIRAPTLVIGGRRDPSTALEQTQAIADRIPGARLIAFDCAHLSNVERAGEFTEHAAMALLTPRAV